MASVVQENTDVISLKDRLPNTRVPIQRELEFLMPDAQIIDGGRIEAERDVYPFDYTPPINPEFPEGFKPVHEVSISLLGIHVKCIGTTKTGEPESVYRGIESGRVVYGWGSDGKPTMIITDSRSQQIIQLGDEGRNLVDGLTEIKALQEKGFTTRNMDLVNALTPALDKIQRANPMAKLTITSLGEGIFVSNIALKLAAAVIKP